MKAKLLEQTERLIEEITDFERVLELETGEEIREKTPDNVQFIQDAKSKLQESFMRRIKALPDAIETEEDKQHAKYIQMQLRSIKQEMKNLTRMQREIEARTPEERLLQKKQRYQDLLLRVIEPPEVEAKYRADKEIKNAIEEHEKLVTNLGGLIKEIVETQDTEEAYDDLILLLQSYQLRTELLYQRVQDRTITLDSKASSLPRKKQLIEYLLQGVIAEPKVEDKYSGDTEITGALAAHRERVSKFKPLIDNALRKPAADERVYDDLIALLESDPIKTTSLHETVKQRIETLNLLEAQKAEERDLAQKHEQQLSEQKTIKHALIEKLGPLSAVKRREFTFSDGESETLTQIQTQKDTLERADDVLFNDEELTRTQQTVERLTDSFNETLEIHGQIKNFLKHSPGALIPFLVKQDDERWLETASQYQPGILSDIETAFSEFKTKEAIEALKTFAEKQGSTSLKEKAKWMLYLVDKGVEEPAQYIRKEDALKVLKEFEDKGLLSEISGEALQDEHFITAVQTLMDSKMLSKENLKHLIGSPARRDVIANRPDVFRVQLKSPSRTTPLEEELQSKLLNALLKSDESVALAIGHVQEGALMSGIIPVLIANEALTKLLSSSESATNLPFLQSELQSKVLTASTHVDDFLSDDRDHRDAFKQKFVMGNQETLNALIAATKEPAAYDLAKMAKVVRSIDDYIRDYNGNKRSLIAFRKDVIPQVLLTTKTPSEKADAVSKLAKSHFKHRHAVARVLLDIIVKGILGIFAYPAYLLGRKSGKEPYFFSRQETKRFQTLKEQVLPELGEAEERTQTPDDDRTNRARFIDSTSDSVTPSANKAAGVAEEDEDNVEETPRVRLK